MHDGDMGSRQLILGWREDPVVVTLGGSPLFTLFMVLGGCLALDV